MWGAGATRGCVRAHACAPTPAAQTSWGALKLSLMLQEANVISSRFHRQFVFGR